MSQFVSPPNTIKTVAFSLRRFPRIHRVGRWLRRTLFAALAEGFWEFVRLLFANSTRFGPPAHTFSVYQELRYHWPLINGRILTHDQGVPKVTGDSLLVLSKMNQHAEQPWPILWSEHHQARLITESLAYLRPDKTLCVESVYNCARWRSDTASRYLRLPPPTELKGDWTSIVSLWCPTIDFPVYGHWLHDALPRLGVLSEFPSTTRIIVPANLKPYHKESLELMGVWDRCRPTSEQHLLVERYFFSSPTSMITCYNPYSIKVLREAFLPKRDPNYNGPKKFYMHRTSSKRLLVNGEEICEFFRSKGWGIVVDVDLTIAQTVKLFSEAEAVCSLLGSNMSNVMFCRPGCTVMQMVLDSWVDGWIDWVTQVCELDYHFKVFPTGGPLSNRFEIKVKAIEDFFSSSGVSF